MKRFHSRRGLPGGMIIVLTAALLFFSAAPGYGADNQEQTGSEYPAWTHLAAEGDESSPYGTGNYLYSSLKVTGTAMQEEQIFTVSDLEKICLAEELSLYRESTAEGPIAGFRGVDLVKFLHLCGLETTEGTDPVLSFYRYGSTQMMYSCTFSDMESAGAVLAVGKGNLPLVVSAESEGYSLESDNQGGPLALSLNNGTVVTCLTGIQVSLPDQQEDPYYSLHKREPLNYMQSLTFTVRFIDQAKYSDKDENPEAFLTRTFTMKEIEDLMEAHPEQVRGSFYGISGNETTKKTYGLGGFCDYYEGLDLCWFLREQAGLKSANGKAVLYGRNIDRYGMIEDLSYFFANKDYRSYYLEIDNSTKIEGVGPILAVSKNGTPLLPLHDHEMEGYVDYNLFHDLAQAQGWDSKVGLVKNVSGPMVAGLSNLDGIYGGYRNETAGDCIQIDLLVNREEYENEAVSISYQDVPSGSWFYDYVMDLTAQGIVNGVSEGLFSPNEQVTRAQFVKMIAGCSGESVSSSGRIFTDVEPDDWAAPYIEWASKNGIVKGTGDGMFCPDLPITREDMAVMADRFLNYRNVSVLQTALPHLFEDQAAISGYAVDSVDVLSALEILNGRTDGCFDPQSNASRAEAAAMMVRMIKKCI